MVSLHTKCKMLIVTGYPFVILKCHCALLIRIFQVIPRAVLYFTGDIFGDDDEDFEDCEDEDSEEED